MKDSMKHSIYANVCAFIAIVLIVGGGYLAVDAWGIMAQIEAQGAIGQAFNSNQYESAVNSLRYGVLMVLIGFFAGMSAVCEDIKSTLYELNE